MTDSPLALRIKPFCDRIGISPATFWKYHKLGKIRSIRIGTRVLIPMIEVDRIVTEGLN
jgi:predicted site-specific integrase-resolvase